MREAQTDILIVGAGLGGVAGALAALRLGKRVILTEETGWIGGQLTSQAVPPDEHPWIEMHGCTATYRELRNRIRDWYRRNYPLLPRAPEQPEAESGRRLRQRALPRAARRPRLDARDARAVAEQRPPHPLGGDDPGRGGNRRRPRRLRHPPAPARWRRNRRQRAVRPRCHRTRRPAGTRQRRARDRGRGAIGDERAARPGRSRSARPAGDHLVLRGRPPARRGPHDREAGAVRLLGDLPGGFLARTSSSPGTT